MESTQRTQRSIVSPKRRIWMITARLVAIRSNRRHTWNLRNVLFGERVSSVLKSVYPSIRSVLYENATKIIALYEGRRNLSSRVTRGTETETERSLPLFRRFEADLFPDSFVTGCRKPPLPWQRNEQIELFLIRRAVASMRAYNKA